MRSEHKQDNANPESAGALSTHICLHFFPIHNPFPLKNPPSYLKHVHCCLRLTLKRTKITDTAVHNVNWTISPYSFYNPFKLFLFVCAFIYVFTCWSTPTASRPSYMMLTHPSLHDSTNSDISAYKTPPHSQVLCKSRRQGHVHVCVRQTCPRLSKLYFRRFQRYPASRHCVLLVMLLTSSPSQ